MTEAQTTSDETGVASGEPVIAPLTGEQLEAAAGLVADCADGTAAGGLTLLRDLQAAEDSELRGLTVDGRLLGVSATRKAGLTFELSLLVVAPEARRRGYGKELLIEALVRAGRRPTVTEINVEHLPFYEAMRFKPVARRKQPDGTFRLRLGWHPPGQRVPTGGATQGG